jgi:hypothetical protein
MLNSSYQHGGVLTHFVRLVCSRAWNAGQSLQALNSYSAALEECGSAPPAFVAVLHCNRAAALYKLRKFTDAISDCLCAIALSPAYSKVKKSDRDRHSRWDYNTGRAGEVDTCYCGGPTEGMNGGNGVNWEAINIQDIGKHILGSAYGHEWLIELYLRNPPAC